MRLAERVAYLGRHGAAGSDFDPGPVSFTTPAPDPSGEGHRSVQPTPDGSGAGDKEQRPLGTQSQATAPAAERRRGSLGTGCPWFTTHFFLGSSFFFGSSFFGSSLATMPGVAFQTFTAVPSATFHTPTEPS